MEHLEIKVINGRYAIKAKNGLYFFYTYTDKTKAEEVAGKLEANWKGAQDIKVNFAYKPNDIQKEDKRG